MARRVQRSGFIPSSPDPRDIAFTRPPSLVAPFLRDQGEVPCCVPIAVTCCMETLDASRPPTRRLAPLFNYHLARQGSSTLADVSPREALRSATTDGVCCATLHPDPERYSRAVAKVAPSEEAREDARAQRISMTPRLARVYWYERLGDSNRISEWTSALSAGLPLLVGFMLTPRYWRLTAEEPTLDLHEDEATRFGHAVVALGVHGESFVVQDSRGVIFGRAGRWLLPFEAVLSAVVVEAWVIRKITFD